MLQRKLGWSVLLLLWSIASAAMPADPVAGRLRVMIETDAGGDPDDEQSLVRFLLYVNEWDVEGIIANRPQARESENRNTERTGLGIVCRLVNAYGQCYPQLVQHDSRYPPPDWLLQRTVAGYDGTDDGVNLLIAAVDRDDPRPLWYSDWGTDRGAAQNNLQRALDRVLTERGQAGYEKFKRRLRLSSADAFGRHTHEQLPLFPVWIDTFRPELEGRRWYHRFSAITAKAGGFDIQRDVLTGHGPLGALYPTNTTHPQKEGDTPTFLYLVPTGMNDPEQPTWGSWAGRYGYQKDSSRPYYWANAEDTWQGTTHRENSLAWWAVHLQNDFRARMNWCVHDFGGANHPPVARVRGDLHREVSGGEKVTLDASPSSDPDGQSITFEWIYYPEPGSYRGAAPMFKSESASQISFSAPQVESPQTLHFVLILTDTGSPPLTRYQRAILTVQP